MPETKHGDASGNCIGCGNGSFPKALRLSEQDSTGMNALLNSIGTRRFDAKRVVQQSGVEAQRNQVLSDTTDHIDIPDSMGPQLGDSSIQPRLANAADTSSQVVVDVGAQDQQAASDIVQLKHHLVTESPSVEGNSTGNRTDLLQFSPQPSVDPIKTKLVADAVANVLGSLKIYEWEHNGLRGFRIRFEEADTEHCKWIQFLKLCQQAKKRWTEVKNGKTVVIEEWENVETSGSKTRTGANGNNPMKIDCETWYVDSLDHGGSNEAGYVEGSEPGADSGIEGDEGSNTVAEMRDAPGASTTRRRGQRRSDAEETAFRYEGYRYEKNKEGNLQPPGAEYVALKYRMDFVAYLVCNDRVVAKVNWWYEFIEEKGEFEQDVGVSEIDGSASGMEEVHADSLADFESGGRNGAK